MKKYLICLMAFAMTVSFTNAQEAKRINGMVIAKLELNDTQKEKLKVINAEYRSEMQKVIKTDMTAEQRKTRRVALEAEKRNKIVAILSAEQKTKLAELESSGDYKMKTKIGDTKTKVKVERD